METERLILSPWESGEWTDLRPIATDVEVMRYITGGVPWTEEQIQAFVERQVTTYAERGFCRWKLIEKASGETAGFCGVGYWPGHLDEPEIGWWLARRCWGKGLATEAARVALRDVFERVRLDRIVSCAVVGNAASIRIMQKLGLTYESRFENGGVALVKYAIDRAAWIKSFAVARSL